jgi:glycosyltransferase involved in cell wall biosynthesis
MASEWPPFSYNQQMFGGTEYMAKGVTENILPQVPKFYNYLCLVLPGNLPSTDPDYYLNKEIVVWIHCTTNQMVKWLIDTLNSPEVAKNIKFIVGVSEYHKQTLIRDFTNVSPEKFVAIPNAFEPVDFDPQKFVDVQKVKLIHASSSYRGMEVLLESLKDVEEDFELNVFNDFYPDTTGHPFADLANDPRVVFWGRTPRKIVSKFMSEAHIHAYPSVWEETFCLVQAEAMSAGLLCVHSDFGALPETSLGYGDMIPYIELSDFYYAEFLTNAIRKIKNGEHDPMEQSKAIREKFSWDQALQHWKALEEKL